MLLGSTRCHLHQQLVKRALSEAQAIQLPFLCPALSSTPVPRRTISTRTQQCLDTRQKLSRPTPSSVLKGEHIKGRGLASAAAAEFAQSYEDFVPFDSPPGQVYSKPPHFGAEHIPPLHGFDLHPSPLILNDAPTTHPTRFQTRNGISGNLNEIHQTLHTCLQVGRLERAAALVRRLNEIYTPDAPGLAAAHKDYLRELTLNIIRTKDMGLLQELLTWFEVEIHKKGVTQDATMFALIIQACLQSPDREKASRTVKRYYKLAQDCGVESETQEIVPELETAFRVSL